VQIRGLLKTLQHTPHYQGSFSKLDPKLQAQIKEFAAGKSPKQAIGTGGFKVSDHPSPGVQHHFSLLNYLKDLFIDCFKGGQKIDKDIKALGKEDHPNLKDLPIIYEDAAKAKMMEVYSDVPFENWGLSVKNTPKYTFVPATVLGIQNLVLWAKENDLRVRCAGYRHSWGQIFGQDGEILVSFVNIDQVTTLPDPMTIVDGDYTGQGVGELKTIQLLPETTPGKRLARIGTAVTSEDFRRWQLANKWVLPVDTVLVEVTMGGITQALCHGAGRRHNTIPDHLRKVEYVDANGKLQVVDDPRQLKVAAGNYGLLGVVTHVTFELDALTYAVMQPRKVDVGLAVPPLSKDEIPPALRQKWFNAADADAQLASAAAFFEDHATNDYYTEYFWCPYQLKSWVHTWNPSSTTDNVQQYPSDADTFFEWVQGWLAGVLTSSPFFAALPGYWQAQFLAISEMAILPPTLGEGETPTIKTAMPDALHFRRGVQNMRVLNMEFEIPLPPLASDPSKPDLSVVRQCWWDTINLVYQIASEKADPLDPPPSPMRILLEMRIMGSSNLVLAPQYGNHLGTASIEVLSIPDTVSDGEWYGFLQRVADKWFETAKKYGDLNLRPHLAKEWFGLKFGGVDARKYLREHAFKDQIGEFKEIAGDIGKAQGWTLGDLKKRFSNELWDEVIFS
jgi:FAD binding domain